MSNPDIHADVAVLVGEGIKDAVYSLALFVCSHLFREIRGHEQADKEEETENASDDIAYDYKISHSLRELRIIVIANIMN